MSKGSNPTNVTTTTSAEPTEFIRPYLTPAFDKAQTLFQSNVPNYYPQQTYTGFAPETSTALQLATNRAVSGNPLLGSSQGEINKILSGNPQKIKKVYDTWKFSKDTRSKNLNWLLIDTQT